MAVHTLAEYKTFMANAVDQGVIDEIRKQSHVLDNIPVVNMAAMNGNRTAWVYSYARRNSQKAAAIRAVNTEYTSQVSSVATELTVSLSIFGGSFEIDRVMANAGNPARTDLVSQELDEQIEGTRAKFHDLVINGDTANAGEFDGLDKALAGSTTEYNVNVTTNLSTLTLIKANWEQFRLDLDKWLKTLNGAPNAIYTNDDFLPIFSTIAKLAGAYAQTTNSWGDLIDTYRGIPILGMGEKDGVSTQIIPVETRTVSAVSTTGLIDMYAVRYGEKDLHAIAPEDKSLLVKTYLPDFKTPGALKKGEVEMVAGIALKATRSCGVFRNIKIQ